MPYEWKEVDESLLKSIVKKWGNSAAVRIPTVVMKAIPLEVDEPVYVREEAGRIVIEPIRQKTYDVNALIKGITKENLHQVVDFGAPAGNEVW